MTQFALVTLDASGEQSTVGNLTEVGGILPNAAGVDAQRGTYAFLTLCPPPHFGTCVYAVYVANGTVAWNVHLAKGEVGENTRVDAETGTVYMTVYTQSTKQTAFVAIDARTRAVTKLVDVGDDKVNVAVSAYNRKARTLYVTVGLENQRLLALSAATKSVTHNVTVANNVYVESMYYDDVGGKLYAWFATSSASGVLGVVEPSTGAVTPLFTAGTKYTANGGTMAVRHSVAYNFLLEMGEGGSLTPSWLVIDVSGNKGKLKSATTLAANQYPINFQFLK